MKKVVFTGGGTSGHVTPNIALIEKLRKEKELEIHYIGGKEGMEKNLIEKVGIPYHGISTGKLRRYFSTKNFTDPIRVIAGLFEAKKIIDEIKPSVIFSKGGFVSVPVVIAGWISKVPVIIHESDLTSGLANRIALPFATEVCISFPETEKHLKNKKVELTGMPIREELFSGSSEMGYSITGFSRNKKVIMVTGGSLGAQRINAVIRGCIESLSGEYQIIHLCGKGKKEQKLDQIEGYRQYEYVNEELKHLFAVSDIIISRAGANTIYEMLLLKKLNILIPLSKKASRGDQILNANSFERQGFSKVIPEEELTEERLQEAIGEVREEAKNYQNAMNKSTVSNGTEKIVQKIKKYI